MNVAIDIRSLSSTTPSGVGHYVLEVLLAMTREDHPEFLLWSTGTSKPTLPNAILNDPKMKLVHVSTPNKVINLGITLGLVTLEQILNQDVDVAWFPNTGFIPATDAKTVLTVHDLAFHFMPDTYTPIDHLRYRITRSRGSIFTADHIIAISQSTANDVIKSFGRSPDDVSVIHHGIASSFKPEYEIGDDKARSTYGITKPYIISLATLEPRKNLASLVEAFTKLRDRNHDLQLVLAGGPGWLRQDLDAAIASSPYSNDIKIIGYVKDTERPGLIRGAQCMALPSRYEGFGMQIVESMACGTPVVTARNSSLSEIAGDAALFVRAMNVNELTHAIETVLEDHELKLRLRARGLSRAQDFRWSDTAKETLAALRSEV
ncbi:MAG TPA: glycosyltransferase family 1 protein [Patescibacteria group bacterium]|nr:glycosyltransferase family 1 protein [Patescibacteria group bacterium]